MATEYKLSYTANEINTKLGKIDSLAGKSEIPTKISELTNDSGFITNYTETDPTVPAWAKASTKPSYTKSEVGLGNVDNVKQYSASNPPPYPVTKVNNKTGAVTLTASDVGADASGTASSAISSHNTNTSAHADIRTALNNKADRTQALFYIEGDSSSTTDTTNKVATWIGSHDEITEYFDGLTILYKVVTAGSTSTTLNINGLGAVTVVRNATTGISTACPVDGILLLTYTVDSSGTAYWKTADYDANTKNTAGTSNKTGAKMYLVGSTSQTSSGTTTYTNSNIYINTSNVLYSAKGFSGDLTGTATKATQDASGNVITSTYETKADASTKLAEVSSQISQLSSEKVDKSNIFLGIASDGLMHIFVDGNPVGSGVARGGGDDVFGYVDENNVVVLSGNLPTGAYTIKYEMTDGSLVDIGSLALDDNIYYTVQNNLTNCTTNNNTLQIIEGESYSATITANSGYELKSVTVTMGGTLVSVSGGTINIANVTGDIVITAVAEVSGPAYVNQIPLSINADGTPFNGGKGYKTGYRLSLSSGSESAQDGTEVTGFIPVTKTSIIRIKNIAYEGDTTRGVVGYDANFTKLTTGNGMPIKGMFESHGTVEGDGVCASKTLNYYTHFGTDDLKYIRLCSTDINDNSIITVDQEIV